MIYDVDVDVKMKRKYISKKKNQNKQNIQKLSISINNTSGSIYADTEFVLPFCFLLFDKAFVVGSCHSACALRSFGCYSLSVCAAAASVQPPRRG